MEKDRRNLHKSVPPNFAVTPSSETTSQPASPNNPSSSSLLKSEPSPTRPYSKRISGIIGNFESTSTEMTYKPRHYSTRELYISLTIRLDPREVRKSVDNVIPILPKKGYGAADLSASDAPSKQHIHTCLE